MRKLHATLRTPYHCVDRERRRDERRFAVDACTQYRASVRRSSPLIDAVRRVLYTCPDVLATRSSGRPHSARPVQTVRTERRLTLAGGSWQG